MTRSAEPRRNVAEGHRRACALLLLLRMQRHLERHVHDFQTFAETDIDRVADDIAGLRYLARAFAASRRVRL